MPPDFGPIYAETDLTRFPVEPWNVASNLIFLIIIFLFARRTRLNYRRYPLVVLALPILAVGFTGGTIFHATRSNRLWLMMDYLPIMILCLLASCYFWSQVVRHKALGVGIALLPLLGVRLLFSATTIPMLFRISAGYSTLALGILLPAALYSARRGWKDGGLLLSALLLFIVAIWARFVDSGVGAELFPMGTHFLWHLFGGVSVMYLMEFLCRCEETAVS